MLDEPITLIDRIIQANREAPSLSTLRAQAKRMTEDQDFVLEDGLLLYDGRLVVLDVDNLRTALIREAYD